MENGAKIIQLEFRRENNVHKMCRILKRVVLFFKAKFYEVILLSLKINDSELVQIWENN